MIFMTDDRKEYNTGKKLYTEAREKIEDDKHERERVALVVAFQNCEHIYEKGIKVEHCKMGAVDQDITQNKKK